MAQTTVKSEQIATNAISGTIIADNAITGVHIAQNAILTQHIDDGQVGTSQLAADAVTGAKLADSSIVTVNIQDDQITAAKIVDNIALAGNVSTTGNFGVGAAPTNGGISTAASPVLSISGTVPELNFVDTSSSANDYWIRVSDGLQFGEAGNSRMYLKNGGNLGIGTTSPSTELQIGDYTDAAETITIATSNNGTGRINFYDNNASEGGSIRVTGETSGSKMHFANRWTSDSDRVTFDLVNGRVGIGVAAPAELLHLYGSNAAQKIRVERREVDGVLADNDEIGALEFWTNEDTYASGAAALRAKIMAEVQDTSAGTNLQFWTGATNGASAERMRIQADGKVGIGTDSPAANIHVVSTGQAILRVEGVNQYYVGMMIKNNYSSTQSQWHVAAAGGTSGWGAANGNFIIRDDTTNSTGIEIERGAGGAFGALYINTNGDVCINTTAVQGQGGCTFDVGSRGINQTFNQSSHVDNNEFITFRNANTQIGSIVAPSSSSIGYNTSSDYRLKENVTYSWNATTRLKQLKPCRFNWIADETNTLEDGFLAHEVQAVMPKVVTGTKDQMEDYVDDEGETQQRVLPQQMDHSKLVPLLIKTIQELEARITAGGL